MESLQNKKSEQGFTLIELSIVLVIIGLIVGGILVGQDLIKGAEIRATVAQVEKYNSAVNTFRTKFNGMPGDIPQAAAANFGLFQLTNAAPLGQGDGNGLIEGGGSGSTLPEGETLAFWRHLSDANLTDGQFGSTAGTSSITAGTGIVAGTVTTMSQSLPPSKTTPTEYFVVFASSGLNYYELMPIATITTAPAYTYGTTGLTPIQSYNMDIKLDDGMPGTGIVVARGIAAVNAAPTAATTSTAATCTIGTGIASDTYNRVAATGGNDPSCAVRFRFN